MFGKSRLDEIVRSCTNAAGLVETLLTAVNTFRASRPLDNNLTILSVGTVP
jgi:serine phosphatase RsbU (regulator of sigma subunit)